MVGVEVSGLAILLWVLGIALGCLAVVFLITITMVAYQDWKRQR